MSLITANGLRDLIADGVITGVDPDKVNAASIDLHLGVGFRVEYPVVGPRPKAVRLARGETVQMQDLPGCEELHLMPGRWCLATSAEQFNLPDGLSVGVEFDRPFAVAGEYKLNSSAARNGLNHLLAGWCDPGWHGGHLTLELHNINKWHTLVLESGMRCGQIVLWEGKAVPQDTSYRFKGRYNRQNGVVASKGV